MRLKALQDFPMGTQMARPFESDDGVRRVVVGQVWDFQVPYGRVWCPEVYILFVRKNNLLSYFSHVTEIAQQVIPSDEHSDR